MRLWKLSKQLISTFQHAARRRVACQAETPWDRGAESLDASQLEDRILLSASPMVDVAVEVDTADVNEWIQFDDRPLGTVPESWSSNQLLESSNALSSFRLESEESSEDAIRYELVFVRIASCWQTRRSRSGLARTPIV